MKSSHLAPCIVGVAAAVGLLLVGVEPGTLVYLAIALACPLMMVLMMRGMIGGGRGESRPPGERQQDTASDRS